MVTRTRLVHRVIGVVKVLILLGTGAYMRLKSPGLFESDQSVRMMYRSTHIYILMAGLINVAIGSYVTVSQERWRRILQLAGSGFVLIAPGLLIWAFFYEPATKTLERPLTLPCMLLLLIGTSSHLLSAVGRSSVDRYIAGVPSTGIQQIRAGEVTRDA